MIVGIFTTWKREMADKLRLIVEFFQINSSYSNELFYSFSINKVWWLIPSK